MPAGVMGDIRASLDSNASKTGDRKTDRVACRVSAPCKGRTTVDGFVRSLVRDGEYRQLSSGLSRTGIAEGE